MLAEADVYADRLLVEEPKIDQAAEARSRPRPWPWPWCPRPSSASRGRADVHGATGEVAIPVSTEQECEWRADSRLESTRLARHWSMSARSSSSVAPFPVRRNTGRRGARSKAPACAVVTATCVARSRRLCLFVWRRLRFQQGDQTKEGEPLGIWDCIWTHCHLWHLPVSFLTCLVVKVDVPGQAIDGGLCKTWLNVMPFGDHGSVFIRAGKSPRRGMYM
jgi:hypothetical protein